MKHCILNSKNVSKIKILTYDGLTKREKSIVWKESFHEQLQYFRYAGKLFVYSFMPSTSGIDELDNWQYMKYLSYTSGIVVNPHPKHDGYLAITRFSLCKK
jgi:hypothetical protein